MMRGWDNSFQHYSYSAHSPTANMSQDLLSQFYTCLNLPLPDMLRELSRLIDQSSSNKDLQTMFPHLINSIFGTSSSSGWGLRNIIFDKNRYEYELMINFFEPQGPMIRLCYKLLSDSQLKYNVPLSDFPIDLRLNLERGRCPQFYADMINVDPQTSNVVSLSMNPFDYYIFYFAVHLINNNNKSYWENWNSVYFTLACDYLMHFLPVDPYATVMPLLPNYTGKLPMAAPLQSANRPIYSPSLLLLPEVSGVNNQLPAQTQARNEVWRSETVLQIFIDIWTSVEDLSNTNIEVQKYNYTAGASSPERVRIVRVLVKHIHAYSAKTLSDIATRSSTLRKYSRQIICTRGYTYVKYLVTTWPLDASFRLVMELWLSLIQPWRYTQGSIIKDRYPMNSNNNPDENVGLLDASYTQFIAENFPTYTCIFQLVLPRFMRLDLTSYKTAVMLFRLGKVFSQPNLVKTLREIEQAMLHNQNGNAYFNQDTSWNTSMDQRNSFNSPTSSRWAAVAKQSITEFNMSTNFQYEPIWSEENKRHAMEFLHRIAVAKAIAEKNLEELQKSLQMENRGFWATVSNWFMINTNENDVSLEEAKKVPTYLTAVIHHLSNIFGLSESSIYTQDIDLTDSLMNHSSFANSSRFPMSVNNKMRNNPTSIQYMGDPDLMPITSYESTIIVRMMYQIATRINEICKDDFTELWRRNDIVGFFAREVLQSPCTIQSYVKDNTYHQSIVRQNLPARLSLRRLGSHAFLVWLTIGYILFRLFSYSGWFYLFNVFCIWFAVTLMRAVLKRFQIMSSS